MCQFWSFKCICSAIHWTKMSGPLSETSCGLTCIYTIYEKQRFWRNCALASAFAILHIHLSALRHVVAHLFMLHISVFGFSDLLNKIWNFLFRLLFLTEKGNFPTGTYKYGKSHDEIQKIISKVSVFLCYLSHYEDIYDSINLTVNCQFYMKNVTFTFHFWPVSFHQPCFHLVDCIPFKNG